MALLNVYIFVCVIFCFGPLYGAPIGTRLATNQDDLWNKPPPPPSSDNVWTLAARLLSSYISHWFSSSSLTNEPQPSPLLLEHRSDGRTSIPTTKRQSYSPHDKKGACSAVLNLSQPSPTDHKISDSHLSKLNDNNGKKGIRSEGQTLIPTTELGPESSHDKKGAFRAVLNSSQPSPNNHKISDSHLTKLNDYKGRKGIRSEGQTLIPTTELGSYSSQDKKGAFRAVLNSSQPSPTDHKISDSHLTKLNYYKRRNGIRSDGQTSIQITERRPYSSHDKKGKRAAVLDLSQPSPTDHKKNDSHLTKLNDYKGRNGIRSDGHTSIPIIEWRPYSSHDKKSKRGAVLDLSQPSPTNHKKSDSHLTKLNDYKGRNGIRSDGQTSIPTTERRPYSLHDKTRMLDTVKTLSDDNGRKQTSSNSNFWFREFPTYTWLFDIKNYVGCIFLPRPDIWKFIKSGGKTLFLQNERQTYLSPEKNVTRRVVLDSSQRSSTDHINSTLLLTESNDYNEGNGIRSDGQTSIPTIERRPYSWHDKTRTLDTVKALSDDNGRKQTSSDSNFWFREFLTYTWLFDIKNYVGCIFLPRPDIWKFIKSGGKTLFLQNERQLYLSPEKNVTRRVVLDSSQRSSTDHINSTLLLTELNDYNEGNGIRSDGRTLIPITGLRPYVSLKRINTWWPKSYALHPSPMDQKNKSRPQYFPHSWYDVISVSDKSSNSAPGTQ